MGCINLSALLGSIARRHVTNGISHQYKLLALSSCVIGSHLHKHVHTQQAVVLRLARDLNVGDDGVIRPTFQRRLHVEHLLPPVCGP